MKKRIKIQGFLIFLSVISVALFYRHLLRQDKGELFDIATIALVFFGYMLRIAARGNKQDLNPDGKSLVTSGPYSLIRNPMYFGTFIIGLGVIFFIFQWWVSFLFILIYLSIYIPEIKQEEIKLSAFFGEKFRDYCKITPRFFPSISALFRPGLMQDLRIKSRWVKSEISSFIWLAAICLSVKLLEIVFLK